MKTKKYPVVVTVLLSVLWIMGALSLHADEWPQWRGPNRDGVWKETGVVEKFSGPVIPGLWSVPVSGGYSGPTVAGGRVYVTDFLKGETDSERVHCFDAMTGEAKWTHSYACEYKNFGYTTGPRASVLVDEGRAYSLGAMGHFHCLDAAMGDVLWKKDLKKEYRIPRITWGVAASPLVEENLVIVLIGGADGACVVAFDKAAGREVWRALDDRASYSAPIVIEQAGKRVLVCWTGDRVAGLNPKTGELYWEHPFKPNKMVINVPTPVFHRNYLFFSAFYDGSLLLKLDTEKPAVEKVWRRIGQSERITDSLHCMISTPYLQGDHIYGVDSYGELRCLDLLTGDRVWESLEAVPSDRWANIHMVRNGDKIWMFNERGELIICRLSPKGFHEISRAKLIDPTEGQLGKRGGVTWSHPAYANRRVYIRNDEELLCADLSADTAEMNTRNAR